MGSTGKGRAGSIPAVFSLLALPLAVGAFVSTGGSWGWDHLHRLGPIGAGAFFLVGLALWTPPSSRLLGSICDRSGGILQRGRLRVPLLLALLGVGVCAALPIATRIYGDSRYILDDYSEANLAIHLKQMLSFGLLARGRASFVLHDLIARGTGLTFEKSYVLVSVVCGGIFLFAHLRLAATLPGVGPGMRAVIAWVGVTDGANQLFFGHVENYTVPRLFASLFLIGVVRSLFDPKPMRIRFLPVLWFLLGVLFHSQCLVLLPTFVLWLGRELATAHPSVRPWIGGRAVVAGLAVSVLGLVVAYIVFGTACYDYIYSGGRPHPRQLFLPITTGCIGLPWLRYTLFSGPHLLDCFGSLYSISSPAILLLLALLLPGARGDPRLLVLIPSIPTAALHNFILNPAIGFPFDWDLMCILSPPLLYTAVFLAARSSSPRRGLIPAVLVLGLGTATLFGINAGEKAVRTRVEDMGVWLHRTYYGGSHYRLSANLSTIRDLTVQADERFRVLQRLAPQTYPDDREVAFLWEKLALVAIDLQDYEGALIAYRSAFRTEPSRLDRLKPLGYLETEVGDLSEGIRRLEEYLAKVPADGEAWLFLGDAQARLGEWSAARSSWRRFLELDPEAPEAPRVRGDLHRMRKPDSSLLGIMRNDLAQEGQPLVPGPTVRIDAHPVDPRRDLPPGVVRPVP